MPTTLRDGSVDIDGDGVGDYCPAGGDCYGGADKSVDPYASTKFAPGTLRKREDLERRIMPDPVDGRKKISMNVKGDSMYPEIKQGDRVQTYVDSKITDAKVGDYVTFIARNRDGSESYYTHKVVETYNNPLGGRELVTRGVNNSRNDRIRTDADNFIGVSRKVTGGLAGE